MQPDHPGSCAPEVPMDAAAAESMNLEEFDQIILETEDYFKGSLFGSNNREIWNSLEIFGSILQSPFLRNLINNIGR